MAHKNSVKVILTERELGVFEAMKYLARTSPEVPSQRELAEYIGCGQKTVGRAMDGLEEKGYISSDFAKVRRRWRSYQITNFKRAKKHARIA